MKWRQKARVICTTQKELPIIQRSPTENGVGFKYFCVHLADSSHGLLPLKSFIFLSINILP